MIYHDALALTSRDITLNHHPRRASTSSANGTSVIASLKERRRVRTTASLPGAISANCSRDLGELFTRSRRITHEISANSSRDLGELFTRSRRITHDISANSRSLGDGECDVACNTESCAFDHGDCFVGHDECYNRADGADYRGTVRE